MLVQTRASTLLRFYYVRFFIFYIRSWWSRPAINADNAIAAITLSQCILKMVTEIKIYACLLVCNIQGVPTANLTDDFVFCFQHFPNNQLMGDNALQNRVRLPTPSPPTPAVCLSYCLSVCLSCLPHVCLSVCLPAWVENCRNARGCFSTGGRSVQSEMMIYSCFTQI